MLTTIVLLTEKIINIILIIILLLPIYYILNILKQLCFEIQNRRMSWIFSGAINISVIIITVFHKIMLIAVVL